MNKDVIYIEPEDDITDIISRLKSSEQKVVALVPSKKLGVLRSAVNNKLIAKAAKESEKAVVMVTADPSLTKIASSAGLPVAKNLQSRPIMPGDLQDEPKSTPEEEIIEDDLPEEDQPEDEPSSPEAKDEPGSTSDPEDSTSDTLEDDASSKKDQKSPKKDKKDIPKFEKYRKRIIIGAIAGVVLICFLVWGLVIAPAAKITVAIKTTAENFAENISLVQNASSTDVKSGRLPFDKETTKNEVSVEFDATGEKDVGEKASGSLTVAYYFGTDEDGTAVTVPTGTLFSYNGLNYYSTSGLTLSWDGDDSKCESGSSIKNGCKMSGSIGIQAAESGANYNLDASRTDWSSNANPQLHIINPSAISGGTSKVIKVVQASDVATARQKLSEKIDNSDLKDKLIKQLSDEYYVIDSSYSTDSPDPVVSPAIDAEASSGKGTLTATTTATIYGVKKSDINDFINEVAGSKLPEDQKIYDIGEPFFEKFDSDSLTAKLKTTTHSGPKVTVAEIMEKSKGHKIGEVQSLLRSINGVANVTIDKSVPWMGTVPDDDNKVQVEMTVEDQ